MQKDRKSTDKAKSSKYVLDDILDDVSLDDDHSDSRFNGDSDDPHEAAQQLISNETTQLPSSSQEEAMDVEDRAKSLYQSEPRPSTRSNHERFVIEQLSWNHRSELLPYKTGTVPGLAIDAKNYYNGEIVDGDCVVGGCQEWTMVPATVGTMRPGVYYFEVDVITPVPGFYPEKSAILNVEEYKKTDQTDLLKMLSGYVPQPESFMDNQKRWIQSSDPTVTNTSVGSSQFNLNDMGVRVSLLTERHDDPEVVVKKCNIAQNDVVTLELGLPYRCRPIIRPFKSSELKRILDSDQTTSVPIALPITSSYWYGLKHEDSEDEVWHLSNAKIRQMLYSTASLSYPPLPQSLDLDPPSISSEYDDAKKVLMSEDTINLGICESDWMKSYLIWLYVYSCQLVNERNVLEGNQTAKTISCSQWQLPYDLKTRSRKIKVAQFYRNNENRNLLRNVVGDYEQTPLTENARIKLKEFRTIESHRNFVTKLEARKALASCTDASPKYLQTTETASSSVSINRIKIRKRAKTSNSQNNSRIVESSKRELPSGSKKMNEHSEVIRSKPEGSPDTSTTASPARSVLFDRDPININHGKLSRRLDCLREELAESLKIEHFKNVGSFDITKIEGESVSDIVNQSKSKIRDLRISQNELECYRTLEKVRTNAEFLSEYAKPTLLRLLQQHDSLGKESRKRSYSTTSMASSFADDRLSTGSNLSANKNDRFRLERLKLEVADQQTREAMSKRKEARSSVKSRHLRLQKDIDTINDTRELTEALEQLIRNNPTDVIGVIYYVHDDNGSPCPKSSGVVFTINGEPLLPVDKNSVKITEDMCFPLSRNSGIHNQVWPLTMQGLPGLAHSKDYFPSIGAIGGAKVKLKLEAKTFRYSPPPNLHLRIESENGVEVVRVGDRVKSGADMMMNDYNSLYRATTWASRVSFPLIVKSKQA